MKILNVILSIVIFLLAAVSATFSYFLFEKRAQFVDGWGKMASAIHESSKELDKNSGTSEAAKLTVEELAHENYENLDDKLPIIVRQSKAVIAQRDAMADMFFRIDKLVKAGNDRDSKGYSSLTDYDSRIKNVNSAVEKTVRDRDTNYNKISSIASRYFGVRLQVTDLRRGAANALTPLEKGVQASVNAKNNYRNALATIAKRVGGSVSSKDSDSKTSGDSVVQKVNTQLAKLSTLQSQLRTAQSNIAQRDRTIKSKDASIKGLNAQLAKAKQQLSQIKRLQLGVADDFEPWTPGCPEARERISGKVTAVNNELGYIVINLGKKSVVMQHYNGKNFPVSPRIAKDMELYIVRPTQAQTNADGSGRKYLVKITLDKVGDNEAIANIPVGSPEISVGDLVLYSISK